MILPVFYMRKQVLHVLMNATQRQLEGIESDETGIL